MPVPPCATVSAVVRPVTDLQVHRQLTALLAGKRPKSDHDELTVLAEHCTRTERRAELAEREIIKVKLLTFLLEKIGQIFQAVIVGVEDFGVFARIIELPVEGLIHVSSLRNDHYYLEPETHTLIGRRGGSRYRLGDRIEVKVARVDIDRRELDLVLVDQANDAEPELPPSRTRSRPDPAPLLKGKRGASKAAVPPKKTSKKKKR